MIRGFCRKPTHSDYVCKVIVMKEAGQTRWIVRCSRCRKADRIHMAQMHTPPRLARCCTSAPFCTNMRCAPVEAQWGHFRAGPHALLSCLRIRLSPKDAPLHRLRGQENQATRDVFHPVPRLNTKTISCGVMTGLLEAGNTCPPLRSAPIRRLVNLTYKTSAFLQHMVQNIGCPSIFPAIKPG